MKTILFFEGPRSNNRLHAHVAMHLPLLFPELSRAWTLVSVESLEAAKAQLASESPPEIVITDDISGPTPSQCGAALYPDTSALKVPLVIVTPVISSEGDLRRIVGLPASSFVYPKSDDWIAARSGIDRLPPETRGTLWHLLDGFGEDWMRLGILKRLLL